MSLKYELYKLFSLVVVFLSYITLWLTFIIAYYDGYTALVVINDYHEADLELIMFLITLPGVIWSVLDILYEKH